MGSRCRQKRHGDITTQQRSSRTPARRAKGKDKQRTKESKTLVLVYLVSSITTSVSAKIKSQVLKGFPFIQEPLIRNLKHNPANKQTTSQHRRTQAERGSSSSVKIPWVISASGSGRFWILCSRLSASMWRSSSRALACRAGAAVDAGRMLPLLVSTSTSTSCDTASFRFKESPGKYKRVKGRKL